MGHIQGSGAEDLLDRLLAADLKTYLHELLMKQDQMSMAASIESRVPFLDHKLVEFAAGLPVNMKLRDLTTKYILRRAMKNRLPRQILTRKKMGFPVPVGQWLRGQFSHIVDEYVLGERAQQRGDFNREFVAELVARHRAGENQTERLWSLINFEIWQRRFIDGEELEAGIADCGFRNAGSDALAAASLNPQPAIVSHGAQSSGRTQLSVR
jgi:asparagine synthase (glutamine-hydrolysing)